MKTSKIYTYSIVYSTSEQFEDKVPYVTAILEDDEGVRFPSFVAGYTEDESEVFIGQEVVFMWSDEAGRAIYCFPEKNSIYRLD